MTKEKYLRPSNRQLEQEVKRATHTAEVSQNSDIEEVVRSCSCVFLRSKKIKPIEINGRNVYLDSPGSTCTIL